MPTVVASSLRIYRRANSGKDNSPVRFPHVPVFLSRTYGVLHVHGNLNLGNLSLAPNRLNPRGLTDLHTPHEAAACAMKEVVGCSNEVMSGGKRYHLTIRLHEISFSAVQKNKTE